MSTLFLDRLLAIIVVTAFSVWVTAGASAQDKRDPKPPSSTVLPLAVPPASSATQPRPMIPNLELSGKASVSGAIRLTDCSANFTDVSVTASGKTVVAEVDPSREFVFRYQITALPAGMHTVAPMLAAGRCVGGSWTPVSRGVDLMVGAATGGQDFEYRVPRKTTRIKGAVVASLIEWSFSGTQIHLNNYGPRHEDSWHRANASYLRLGPALGGSETRFDIPEASKGPWRFYVNDVNVQSITVQSVPGAFKMLMKFESSGTEIKGRCSAIVCVGATDAAAPDFQLDNAIVEISLVPALHRTDTAGISYGAFTVRFSASVDGAGPLGETLDGLAKNKIKTIVEAKLSSALEQRSIKDRLAAAITPLLSSLGVLSITGVRMDGADLIIEYLPR